MSNSGWGRGLNRGEGNTSSRNHHSARGNANARPATHTSNNNVGREFNTARNNNHSNERPINRVHNNAKQNFHDNKGQERLNILGYRRFTELLTMQNDEVITALDKNSKNFIQTLKQTELKNDFLTVLVQVIGEKLCGETSLVEIRNSLIAIVADPDFLKKLQNFTLTLVVPSSSVPNVGNRGMNKTGSDFVLDTSPLRILNAMCDLYAFICAKMQNLAADHLQPNVVGAQAVLQMLCLRNLVDNRADDVLERLTKLEQELNEFTTLKGQKELGANGAEKQTKHFHRGKLTESDLERLYLMKPDNNFVEMSIVPSTEEILAEEEPFLRPNLIKGKYPSALTYLDVQFRLLREDFVAPLRESVKEWVNNEPAYSGKKKKLPPGTIRFYHDVKLKKVECLQEVTIYSLQFSTANLKRVKWEKSKRLLSGSLVLLTSDKFQTIYFATIYRRDERQLANGIVGIVWEGRRPESYADVVYLMVECEVYFESYRHTLKALQFMAKPGPPHYDAPLFQKYRMAKYIVDMFTEEVPLPLYLRNTKLRMDFSMVLACNAENVELMSRTPAKEENKTNVVNAWLEGDRSVPFSAFASKNQNEFDFREKILAAKLKPHYGNAHNLLEWPSAADLGMDKPQYMAFQSAITHELSIIQGPPGTGKTYIGLQIIKLFLANPKIIWGSSEASILEPVAPENQPHNLEQLEHGLLEPDAGRLSGLMSSGIRLPATRLVHSPILIVCYTNHALDQFLEGIILIMKSLGIDTYGNLIRVGGRSKVEALAEYSIKEQRDRYRKLRMFDPVYAESRTRLTAALRTLQIARAELKDVYKGLGTGFGVVDFAQLSQRVAGIRIQELISDLLPPILHTYFIGTGTGRRLLNWLGLNIDYFKNKDFNSHQLLRHWFRFIQSKPTYKGNENINAGAGPQSGDGVNPESNGDEGEEDLEDFGLKEIMEANRLEEEILMETDLKSRDKVRIPYVHLSPINITNEFSALQTQYRNAEAQGNQQLMRQILYKYNDVQNEEIKWKNQNRFLDDLLSGKKEGTIDLQEINKPQGLLEQLTNTTDQSLFIKFSERWAIYFYVIEQIQRALLKEIMTTENRIITAQERVAEVNNRGDGLILEKAMIVGLTTTGAAKYNTLLRMMKSRIVIVEEAAEVLESHIVTSITEHCEHLILIGDHQQLRPSTTVYKLAKDYSLDISLFERLIKNDLSWHYLKAQHRMRPEICKLLVPAIYEDLENYPNVLEYSNVSGFAKNLFFITHHEYEKADNDSMTKSNEYEARFLAKLCRYVMLQGYEASQVTVLVTYIGQMFLVKKLINEEGETCRGVRVTVVDNFQGEENDIILLSLVRSNEDNRVGFLKTDNRICVALSRAKQGMFVIGNMDCLLNSKSKTWAKISEEFHDQDSIGNELQLKCQIHGDIIPIGSPEDFQLKAPEGGCTKPCPGVLPNCNHSCRLICHVTDKNHVDYKCKLNCERHCSKPEKHPCPSPCFEIPCPPCTVLMMRDLPCGHINYLRCHVDHLTWKCKDIVLKTLPCGHQKELPCYFSVNDYTCVEKVPKQLGCGHVKVLPCPMPITEWECVEEVEKELRCGHSGYMKCNEAPESFNCKVMINKMLPCDHEQQVLCSQDIHTVDCRTVLNEIMPVCKHKIDVFCFKVNNSEDWECQSKCDTRLPCGHQCILSCHARNDPNHDYYRCKKQCARTCEANHPCNTKHQCCKPCEPCPVITDKTLPCGHVLKKVKCHVDPDNWKCNQPCLRKLQRSDCPFEHACLKKCHENCSPCMEVVEKAVKGCDHSMKVLCHAVAERSNCEELVPAKVKSLCGHSVEVPCRLLDTCTPEDCLRYCHQPCGHVSKENGGCDHPCDGDCSSCFQGRIHVKCQKKCGRVLTCGHVCKFPCSKLCPPCEEKCTLVCTHSKCKKACGFPCTVCKERCKWSCEHKKCTRKCSEICNREACDEPCKKKLKKCEHDCIGMCGEPCPPLCRTCDKTVVQELFFGDEDEEDARFVFLEDCKHLIHKDSMDKWMSTEPSEGDKQIGIKRCPKCSLVITQSVRYGNILKKRLEDVMAVRNKIFGNDKTQKNFQREVSNQLQAKSGSNYVFESFRQQLEDLTCSYNEFKTKKGFRVEQQLKEVDQYTFESLHNMVNWWSEAEENVKLKPVPYQQHPARILLGTRVPPTPIVKQDLTEECRNDLIAKYRHMFGTLLERKLPLSTREIEDFDREFHRLFDFYRLYCRRGVQGFVSFRGTELMFNVIKKHLEEPKPYDKSLKDKVSTLLKQLDGLIESGWQKEEKDRRGASLFKAMGFNARHWYKCSNGHIYTVGDCGQFNQASRCPECQTNIGRGTDYIFAGAEEQIVAEITSTLNEPVPDFSYRESSRGGRNNNRRGHGRGRGGR